MSRLLAAAGVVLYFLHFASAGLWGGFTHDDLMNLALALQPALSDHALDTILFFRPSSTYRPFASIFYRLLFDLFGFTPLPYRIACYTVLAANVWLAWKLALHITRSRRTAFVTVMLFAYHGQFWPLYQSTGFCYDLLCFFFYALALLYYLRVRRDGRIPGPRQIILWAVLYVLCLGSKEMAVSLPVVILACEALRNPPRSWMWLIREGRVAMTGGIMTVLFLAGRMTGPAALSNVEAYKPDLRISIYLDRAGLLLSEALYHPRPHNFVLAVILLMVLPVVCRSRLLRLGLIWMAVGILPVAFIAPRGLAQAYIPAFGLALFAGAAWNVTLRRLPGMLRPAAVFALLPVILFLWHSRYGRLDNLAEDAQGRLIRTVFEQLETLSPSFPERGKVLLLKDPFPENDWASTFLVLLHSRERSLHIARIGLWLALPDTSERVDFDVVLSYEHGSLIECDQRPFRNVAIRDLPRIRCDAVGIAYGESSSQD